MSAAVTPRLVSDRTDSIPAFGKIRPEHDSGSGGEGEGRIDEAGMRFSCPIFGTPVTCSYMSLHALTACREMAKSS